MCLDPTFQGEWTRIREKIADIRSQFGVALPMQTFDEFPSSAEIDTFLRGPLAEAVTWGRRSRRPNAPAFRRELDSLKNRCYQFRLKLEGEEARSD